MRSPLVTAQQTEPRKNDINPALSCSDIKQMEQTLHWGYLKQFCWLLRSCTTEPHYLNELKTWLFDTVSQQKVLLESILSWHQTSAAKNSKGKIIIQFLLFFLFPWPDTHRFMVNKLKCNMRSRWQVFVLMGCRLVTFYCCIHQHMKYDPEEILFGLRVHELL